ncbi:MAG: FliI/YscN family ATPase [Pontiellaceae bacterium]|nr:FliI/YscN family ATPase [Pontiellaceae bacterium]MBN2784113.1 FliI/YscN family ATPase [Pontiellaceae bacterium]
MTAAADQTNSKLNFDSLLDGLESATLARCEGRVVEVAGQTVKSVGPHSAIGDLVWLEPRYGDGGRRIPCEVVGFHDRYVISMPVERLGRVHPGARVIPGGRIKVGVGRELLGRVVDFMGRPIDNGPPLQGLTQVDIDREAPPAMDRQSLSSVFETGVRAIDGILTLAKGQRVGIFAGSGVGKSVLLGSLARNARSGVNVIALIGERGREVKEFIEKNLGEEGLKRSVVVAVTSDQSPVSRLKGASTAMAIAEYFRDQGEDVMLMMDSVTRYAMAQREIGLSVGEPPTTRGYPPSVFSLLPQLLERAGAANRGTITAFYTVLVESDDMNDPIGDTVRGILDGHIVLSRKIAAMAHYPAIDIPVSLSRLMNDIATPDHKALATRLRSLLAVYQKAQDLVNVGAYVKGSNQEIEAALKHIDGINAFLRQRPEEHEGFESMLQTLKGAIE